LEISPGLEMIVLMGIPGAGKSTFYRAHFAATHAHVSKDNFRRNPNPRRRQRQLIEAAIQEGKSVVVDNTSVAREDRAGLLQIAGELGIPADVYVFPKDVEGSRDRNEQREGKAKVPIVAIYTAAKRFELPAEDEGFRRRYWVELSGEGGFAVREWTEDESERI